jgi:hypothetical protein
VARYRKTAIAALAVSALLLTPTAAYADHNHRGVSASSEERSMSWGYYSGDVTDYKATGPDIFADANASAIMIGLEGRSYFRLRVSGIAGAAGAAPGGTYGVHLHQGPCDADFPGDLPDGAGPHYNVTWQSIGLLGPDIKKTEVWLDLDVNSDGYARSTATVSFIPKGKRSIVLHAVGTDPVSGSAGARLACLPFNIN